MLKKLLPAPSHHLERARKLRRRETPAEHRLWLQIRNKQFHGIKFRRQVPLGRYIADFLCVQHKLIVELDGAYHEKSKAYDARRDFSFKQLGFNVLRFENHEVFENMEAVLKKIASTIFSK